MSDTECKMCSREYHGPTDYLKGTSRFRICSLGHLWFECSCGSGLVLEYGDFDWYSPSMHLGKEAKSIFNEITKLKKIPHIPNNVMKLQEVIANQNATSKDIERQIKTLPSIALNVIETANNLVANTRTKINDLQHAISFIGRAAVNDLVTKASIQNFAFETRHFSNEVFWKESVLCGRIAEKIAQKLNLDDITPFDAYLAGSFSNIGKVISAICFPDITDEIYRLTNDPSLGLNWTAAEKKATAISHCTLGEIGSALWGFPLFITQSITNHHTPPSKVRDEAQTSILMLDFDQPVEQPTITMQKVVAIANQFCHWVLLQPTRMDEPLFISYTQAVGWSDSEVNKLGEDLTALLSS